MKKIITFCASLALLLAVSGGAKATVFTDMGTISVPGDTGSQKQPPANASFEDEFLFKIDIPGFVVELTSILNPNIDLDTFELTVWTSTMDADAVEGTLLATAVQGPAPDFDNIFQTVAFLVSFPLGTTISGVVDNGQLFVRAKGDTFGSTSTGNYSILVTVSAVPLPPAAVLFLSALAGLVGFSRIRRRRVAT